MNMPSPIHATTDSGVDSLTLNRPEAANALSSSLVEALHRAINTASRNDVHAIVLRGNYDHFCAGFDLSGLEAETDATLLYRFCRIGLLFERLATAPVLTIAVIDGAAVGTGADLAMACDHRIVSPTATLQFPGAGFGAVLGIQRLVNIAGHSHTLSLASSGQRISGAEASAACLARLAPDADTADRDVAALAAGITRVPAESRSALLAASRPGSHATSLAELLRSIAQPGLKDRIAQFAHTSRPRREHQHPLDPEPEIAHDHPPCPHV